MSVAHVAHAGVDDEAADAARQQALGEQVAEVAVLAGAGRRHDEDVAGAALLDGDVDHPVVAGRDLAGHRVAGDARAAG